MNFAQTLARVAGLGVLGTFVWSSCSKPAESSPEDEGTPPPFSIRVTVPDGGWRLRIERVIELRAEIWILAQLRREPGPGVQMIQEIEAAVPVTLPKKNLRVFVAGKTWAWANDESHEFVPSLDSVVRRAGSGRTLFPQK